MKRPVLQYFRIPMDQQCTRLGSFPSLCSALCMSDSAFVWRGRTACANPSHHRLPSAIPLVMSSTLPSYGFSIFVLFLFRAGGEQAYALHTLGKRLHTKLHSQPGCPLFTVDSTVSCTSLSCGTWEEVPQTWRQ